MDEEDQFDTNSEIHGILEPFLGPQATQLAEETSSLSRRSQIIGGILRLLPQSVRHRWLRVSINLDTTRIPPGQPLDFEVTIENRAPLSLPLSLNCRTLWGWYIDGHPEGQISSLYTSDPRPIQIPSLQTYTFERSWRGYIQTGSGYEPLEEGEHSLSAKVHVPNANSNGVIDDVTFTVDSSLDT